MHTHKPARRHFLRLSSRLAALGLTGLGLGPSRSWFVTDASAAPVNDYKALVCIFLFGGNDGNNMVVPVDTASFAAYTSLRAGVALAPGRLLAPIGTDAGGVPCAMNNNLTELNSGYGLGKLAIVLNTGSLERPLSRAQYQQGLQAPANLFSHSDQQLQAQTATSQNVTSGGWGGRLLDVFGVNDTLGAVSVSSPAMFLQSGGGAPNVIPPGANLALSGMSFSPAAAADARKAAVAAMLALDGGNPLRAAANDAFADGLQLAQTLAGTGAASQINTVFPGNGLGTQLKQVAQLIKLRSQIGPGRQVFFCSMNGFDTHTSQDGNHSSLMRELSSAMGAFYLATEEIGLPNNVTAFTQSDFGRTFQPNGSGTDHAWGNQQFVLGGGVRGGIYGRTPVLALGGPDDSGDRGAWIPTIGTSQYGATLGRWFGASPGELAVTFPNLANFSTTDVGFML
ncbi:MAG: DUF1501 domain-containing protein [Acidobacteriota bacterium]